MLLGTVIMQNCLVLGWKFAYILPFFAYFYFYVIIDWLAAATNRETKRSVYLLQRMAWSGRKTQTILHKVSITKFGQCAVELKLV